MTFILIFNCSLFKYYTMLQTLFIYCTYFCVYLIALKYLQFYVNITIATIHQSNKIGIKLTYMLNKIMNCIYAHPF